MVSDKCTRRSYTSTLILLEEFVVALDRRASVGIQYTSIPCDCEPICTAIQQTLRRIRASRQAQSTRAFHQPK